MKIVVISDIHANLAAIKALPEERYDQLWCLGDLVNYGPWPHETIQWVIAHARATVRGNHDHAVGFGVTPECSLPYKGVAEVMRQYTQDVCTKADLEFLRELPLRREVMVDRTKFLLVHAAPADPLFRYMPERSEHWLGEVRRINTDVLFVGHTHMPFVRTVDNCTIVNPGSIGQSKTGRTTACYATWEDGHIELKEYEYPIEETVLAIQRMPVPERDRQSLISILLTGRFPAPQSDPEILLSH